MNDLISRQAAIDALRTCYDTETVTMDNGDEYINYDDAVGEIEQLPPAQPMRKKGKWIMVTGQMHMRWRECSECGSASDLAYKWSFCPRCGADLRGENE